MIRYMVKELMYDYDIDYCPICNERELGYMDAYCFQAIWYHVMEICND